MRWLHLSLAHVKCFLVRFLRLVDNTFNGSRRTAINKCDEQLDTVVNSVSRQLTAPLFTRCHLCKVSIIISLHFQVEHFAFGVGGLRDQVFV